MRCRAAPASGRIGTWRRSATDAERIGTRVDYPQGGELPEQDPERFKAGMQPPCVLGVIVLNCPNKSYADSRKKSGDDAVSSVSACKQRLDPSSNQRCSPERTHRAQHVATTRSPTSWDWRGRYHGRTDPVVNLPRRKRSRLFESGFAHNMA